MIKEVNQDLCLEKLEAIDLRQRKARYRIWASIIGLIILAASGFMSYGAYLIVLELGGNVLNFIMITYWFILIVLCIVTACYVDLKLSELYFPEKEETEDDDKEKK